ncbi:hypothetical protein [Microvirga sp. VF16]|uniref:hypothetical protein n=1 Tax=Microvirga sp. VF16 TaxID=2807101 RepID=UPI00193E5C98|nr:hypothetical protein [Microvirga sp. VF16]QRM32420.1 hypothetical protein JO965_30410 [Microvirga sp. VF16]
MASIALFGCLIGIAAVALHQIHHAVTNTIPEDVYTHVFTEVTAGAFGGALLFATTSFLRRWFKRFKRRH